MTTKNKTRIPIHLLGVHLAHPGDVRVERLEDRLNPKVPFPHRHDFFQITFFTSGRGWHEIDFKKHSVSKNRLFLMKPGQMHSWSLDPKSRGYIIEFTKESLPLDLKKGLDLIYLYRQTSDRLQFSNAKSIHQFQSLCQIMADEFSANKKHSQTCLQGYLYGLLIQLLRDSDQLDKVRTYNLDLVESFQTLLEKNFAAQHAVTFYADQLRLTPKALTMRLTRSLGQSPRQLIQDRIILEAKRLIAYSDLSMAEVGFELGFNDANYFSRFFKEHTGHTPKKFKLEMSQKR